MIRTLITLPLALLLLAAAPLSAAPRPDDKPGGPAVVGQAKSLNDLLEIAKKMVKNIGGEALYKEFEQHTFAELDPKKVPGIDPKRPFGLYGFVANKLEDCRGVLLIPVPSEKDFTDMLEAQKIPFAKGKVEGTYDINLPPDVPIPVSFRIYKEYAYVSLGGVDVLDQKVILDPKDVISDKEKGAAYISIRLDRVSPDAKKAMLALIREQTEQLREQIPDEDLKGIFQSVEKLAHRWLKILFDEGKEITLRLDADTKSGEVFLDVTTEGMPKSSLTELFAQRKPTTNAFASLAGDDFAQRIFAKAPLFADEAKEALSRLIDFGSRKIKAEFARGGAPEEALALVDATFKSLKANVTAGEMDLAAAIRGPNKEGFYTAVGAVHCKEGEQLEKAIRDAVKIIPERERAFFKFDAGKIGDIKVHEIDMSAEAGEPAKKVFGKGQTAYFAFAKDALYASYGPDGMKLLKEVIDAKPGPAAVLDTTSDGKKIAELAKRLMPEGNMGGGFGVGWMEAMTSSVRVSVEGGDKLKIRVGYNLGTLMYFMAGRAVGTAQPPPVAAQVEKK
jgi:hypothetical protein